MKYILLLTATLSFSLTSCKDDDNSANVEVSANRVPSVVRNSFKQEFPNAKDVEWELENTNYEVDFEIGDVDYQALVASNGNILKYKHKISSTPLPEAILSKISSNYGATSIDDTDILNINGTIYYQVELDDVPNDKHIVFDENGEVVTTLEYYD